MKSVYLIINLETRLVMACFASKESAEADAQKRNEFHETQRYVVESWHVLS